MGLVGNIFIKTLKPAFSRCLGIRPIFTVFRSLNTKNSDPDESSIEEFLETDEEYETLASRYLGHSMVHSCFVVHPYVKWGPKKVRDTTPEQQLQEAVALIRTLAPWTVRDAIIVPLLSLHKKSVFGSGTLEKLKKQVRGNPSITAVFINSGTLKNMQLKELETEFGVPIFDRYKIVMQILRLHATSTHAKLQVALAELPYLWSRLRKDDFSVIASGDYDTRRFMLQSREQKLKTAIKKLHSQRQLLRNRRKQMEYPVVAVVGYTNAGKTSLIKALTGEKGLQPRNQLFATLDVTMHAGLLPSSMKVLYVDTVGFISDIPTNLIECFVVTLEDAMLADVIVHVEDLSSSDLIHQRNHVLITLQGLAVKTGSQQLLEKLITVGNKCDLAPKATPEENSIVVSSTTLLGIDRLRHKLEQAVLEATDRKVLTIRVASGREEMRWLYKNSTVVSVVGDEDSEYQNLKVIITKARLEQFKHHFIRNK